MEPINTAIIAFGKSGKTFHAPLLHVHPGFEINSILERNDSDSREEYGYTNLVRIYDDILKDKSIELVVITTPVKVHYEQAKAAIAAGKHVILEKPAVPRLSELVDLEKLAMQNKVIVSVYQNRRWDGDFLWLKEQIDHGYFGAIYEIESRFDRFRDYVKGWKEEPGLGNGILYDLGSHLIDQAFQLFGTDYSLMLADVRKQRSVGESPDYFEVQLMFDDIKYKTTACMTSCQSPRFVVRSGVGTFIKYGIDPQESHLVKYGKNWNESPPHHEEHGVWYLPGGSKQEVRINTGSYLQFYNGIYQCLRNGRENPVSLKSVKPVIDLMEKIS